MILREEYQEAEEGRFGYMFGTGIALLAMSIFGGGILTEGCQFIPPTALFAAGVIFFGRRLRRCERIVKEWRDAERVKLAQKEADEVLKGGAS